MKIVIVEDEARTRNGLRHLINKLNPTYEVVGEADNGLDGLTVTRRLCPDLVIADIKMPRMDGLEMIARLKDEGLRLQIVLLSGYADFKFAQQAIQYGVMEYLLKPITANDLKNVLKKAEGRILSQTASRYEEMTPEELLKELLSGRKTEKADLSAALGKKCGLPETGCDPVLAAVTHMEEGCAQTSREKWQGFISWAQTEWLKARIITADLGNDTDFVTVICGLTDGNGSLKAGKALFNEFFRISQTDGVVVALGESAGLGTLCESVKDIRQNLLWAKVLRTEKVIIGEMLKLPPGNFNYPEKLEMECVKSLYAHNRNRLSATIHQFIEYCQGSCRDVSQISEAFIRFASSILNALKESSPQLYGRIDKGQMLSRIDNSVTWQELTAPLLELEGLTDKAGQAEPKTCSLVVSKALGYIDEHYQKNLSLEDLANDLHVTPEYLSSVFRREVGETYKNYLTKYRINKAKEMLASTNLKIYEIAGKTGYLDPKYFCNVFKKITGVSPGEYMRILSR